MARTVNQTALETFVKGYLKKISLTSNKSGEIKFMLKGIALIQQFLGYPCCLTNVATYTMITPHDNQLTTEIKATVTNNPAIRRGFLLSLKRIINLLNLYIYGCCYRQVVITFDPSISETDAVLRLYDVDSGEQLFQTSTTGGSTQTVELSERYFGPVALVGICINNIVDPGADINQITDGFAVLVSSSSLGETCGIVQPAKELYTVQQI